MNYANSHTNVGFCLAGQISNAQFSKAQFEEPAAPSILKVLDSKVLDNLRDFDVILIDTCELMSSILESFFTLNADALRENNIKFCITPPVMMELYRHCSSKNEDKRTKALQGWNLVVSPEFIDFLGTYPPSTITTQADPNLVDAARNLKLRYEKNVLILTSDKKLTSSIYNACSTETLAEIGGKLQVLYIDKQTAQLTRYHESRLENLTNDVIIPSWNHIGQPKAPPVIARYFHDAIYNGTVIMDSCALKYAFCSAYRTPFMENIKNLDALRPGQKITVVSSSLYSPEIRAAVEALPHIFSIIEPYNNRIREEDALFHAILDLSATSRDKHLTLITNHPKRYDGIVAKLPTCHQVKEFWGCYIDSNGLLRKSRKEDIVNSI